MKSKKTLSNKPPEISVKDLDLQTPIRNFFKEMGEDPNRSEIKNTPTRFEEAVKSMLSGYDRDFEKENRFFENKPKYKDIIILKNIDFLSLCEHHIIPFYGYAHVAYIPSEKAYLGISKLARAVDIFARRLQTQENLGFQVADTLMKYGKAKGVAILIEARHLCTVARGVEKKVPIMTTCAFYGNFEKNHRLQQNFIELVRNRRKI